MSIEMKAAKPVFPEPQTLWFVCRSEWKWWLPGAIFSFVLASVLMSGWPAGLVPNLQYPYIYKNDGLFHSWVIQRSIEGWIFDNPRSGYPFGSNLLDFPGSDAGNFLVLKLLGYLSGSFYAAYNLYFLLGFSTVFVSAFCVFRSIRIGLQFSLSAAFIFAFLPFHFLRIGHLFYTWYFVVPLYFYIGYIISGFRTGLRYWITLSGSLIALSLIILSSFGVYYALFGVIIILISGLFGGLYHRSFLPYMGAAAASLFIAFGVLFNTLPNIINHFQLKNNLEVAQREPRETEVHALKLSHLLMPRTDHRIEALAKYNLSYNTTFPLNMENKWASLGLVGALGFLSIFLYLLLLTSGRLENYRLAFFSLTVLSIFLIATMGGFNVFFATLVSPMIRGWNRISVFIGFGSLAAFFIFLELLFSKFLTRRLVFFRWIFAFILGVLGILDQTVNPCAVCNNATQKNFSLDQNFIREIERVLPEGSAIYQLPYLSTPEGSSSDRLKTYDLIVGFLHSELLRWNYAGMKGREGDLFYRSLSQAPIDKQLEVIRRLGFAGIYIDRRGFSDEAQDLIDRLTLLLGHPPALVRADGQVVLFRIYPVSEISLEGLSNSQIMQRVGWDLLGVRYPATLSEGIDFARHDWPVFVRNITGISENEPWGRWSDMKKASSVRLDFTDTLPNKFTLVLAAKPFGPNANEELAVKIGSQVHRFKMPAATFVARLPIELKGEIVDSVEFLPPYPTSPQMLGNSKDTRLLGVGFMELRFEE